MTHAAAIERAFRDACLDELAAPKPGNVHRYADGHRMTVGDFERSADAAAPKLCAQGVPLGLRIRDAVVATGLAVGQNTNLGIVLLCAPIAMAAEMRPRSLRQAAAGIVAASDVADAQAIFDAIRIAAPGGLGSAPRHDVRDAATTTAREAMREAADRDSVARQWSNGFADIFGMGLAAYDDAFDRWRDPVWSTLATYLCFLSSFPDSHVMRKHGGDVAEHVRMDSKSQREALRSATDPMSLLPALLAWDRTLKAASINPGTSADLTVATAFVRRLRNALPCAGDDG